MPEKTPVVSVVMPVYNTRAYIGAAIESVLRQSFRDFEFLIYDDCSTDGSAGVIRGFKDPRIRLIESKRNLGYLPHLNEGLRIARGKYIARMDSDDVSAPGRLQKQVDFMERNPGVGACGTAAVTMGAGLPRRMGVETDDARIRCKLLFANQLIHPTAMLRASLIREKKLEYRQGVYFSEDYQMWVEIAGCARLANLPGVLLKYRLRPNQVRDLYHTDQYRNWHRIITPQIEKLGIHPTKKDLIIHCATVFNADCGPDDARRWFVKLDDANRSAKIYPTDLFSDVLSERWSSLCLRSGRIFRWAGSCFSFGRRPAFLGAARSVRSLASLMRRI